MVAALVAIGFGIRAFHFGIVPVGLNQDEAMAAVDAKALAEYGTDRFGMRYPTFFTAWGGAQMSVLESYCMIPFIRLFGLSIKVIRFPMLLVSSAGLGGLYYLGKRLGGVRLGMISLLLGIVCPWHYMQSRWALEANFFPHFFILGVCFLLGGLRRKWLLYVSMAFFGLCSYAYGVANYSVPLFLLIMVILLTRHKAVSWKEAVVCAAIYFLVAGPELLTLAINAFGWETIETGWFTLPYFPDSGRAKNILFANFSWSQLWDNCKRTIAVLFFNGDTLTSNSIGAFGPLYHFTFVFFFLGTGVALRRAGKSPRREERICYGAILAWFFMGLWIGMMTEWPLINRLNVIFYAMLLLAAAGVLWCVERWRIAAAPIFALYAVSALLFARTYYGSWEEESRDFYYESYVNALYDARSIPCDYYYISADPQGTGVREVGRILTMFCHEIDAAYFQGKTNVQDGLERLPYEERYTYYVGRELTEEIVKENESKSVVYLVGGGEINLFSPEDYHITSFYDSYFVVSRK